MVRHKIKAGRKTVLLAGVAALLGIARPAAAVPTYQFAGTIPIPLSSYNTTGTFIGYDLSTFDATNQLYYLTDRSNNGIDVFSAATNSYVERLGTGLFTGNLSPASGAGPNGISISTLNDGSRLLLAGNGTSNVVAFNLAANGLSLTNTRSISTAVPGTPTPQNRVDGVAYAPTTNTILTANNTSNPGYLTLVDNATSSVRKVILLNGTNGTPNVGGNGVEATLFNTVTGTFFAALPALTPGGTDAGGVVQIDPSTGAVIKVYDFNALGLSGPCSPTGAAQGPNGSVLVVCSTAGTATIALNPAGNGQITVIPGISGADQLAFDPTRDVAFTSSRFQPGGPVVGIIDAGTNTLVQTVPNTYNNHSVAVDPVSGEVFVAFDATSKTGTDPFCSAGCIGVYALATPVPEPGTLTLLAAGVGGLAVARRRRRRAG